MRRTRTRARWIGPALAGAVVLSAVAGAPAAHANVPIKVVSLDPYTTTTSYHKTEVEPDTFAHGTTVVTAFQVGRFQNGGASNVGWAASTDGGVHWGKGFLPGITTVATPPGPYDRDTDPSVGYDAKHGQWIIVTLDSKASSGFSGDDITVSRSADGLTWGSPVTVKAATSFQSFDSTWIACDGWSASPHYGNCYVEWDDNGSGNILHLSTSTDGGLTWHEATTPGSVVIGGKPLAQPNGNVVVPIDDGFASSAESFVSTDGGLNYTGPYSISSFQIHSPAGGLRGLDIPSADVDTTGKVYVTWYDCRFRSGCSSNDIVMSTSTNGQTWTSPVRIPIDPTSSTDDHFLAGVAVQPGTGGSTAHLALTYWYYQVANCTSCQLYVGFTSSHDGGATWGAGKQVGGPYGVTWYPSTTSGYMVGDYSSISGVQGGWETVFALAKSSPCTLGANNCKVTMVAPASPLKGSTATSPVGTHPVTAAGRVSHAGGLISRS